MEKKENAYQKLTEGRNIQKYEANLLGEDLFPEKNFDFNYSFLRNEIGYGRDAVVFEIEGKENLVSKFPRSLQKTQRESQLLKIINGMDMQKKARKLGIPFPESKGIYKVFDKKDKIFYIGHVMKKLPGKEIPKIKNDLERKKAKEEFNKILDRAEDLGFRNLDNNYKNGIWDEKNQEIGIIDADEWKYIGLK